jgi:hypothetical protein
LRFVAWGSGRPEAAQRGIGAAGLGGVGRNGMGMRRGAHVSMRGERQGAKAKRTNPKGKCTHENTRMVHGSNGLVEEAATCKMDGPARGELGWSGQILGEDSNIN